MNTTSRICALILIGFSCLGLMATPAEAALEKEIMEYLIPPDLLMRHADQIGLSEEQRKKITRAIQLTQAEATEIQWQLQTLSRSLVESLATTPIDRAEVEKRARAVMEIEQKVKLRHLSLLVEIKNGLRPEQVERLRELAAQ